MTDKEIISLIQSNRGNRIPFKYCKIMELRYIFNFFERNLKTKKGNWSKNKVEDFENKIGLPYGIEWQLECFYEAYSKRIKPVLTFKPLFEYKPDLRYENFNGKLELKEDVEIKDFLEALKEIKKKYLKGSDEKLFKILDNAIKTGYTKETLRNYYYTV
jgi:hypothetical protein